MRVAQVERFGGPEVLVPAELPDPVAGPDEVVIAVDHIDTLFVQTQIRAGAFGEYFDVAPPYVPGGGVSGTVVSTGAEVDPAVWAGRRVIAAVDPGSYASLAAVPVDHLVPVPDAVGLREAAALVHDAVTALALLDLTALKAGETVLITGASGGMGTLLVQLARSRGRGWWGWPGARKSFPSYGSWARTRWWTRHSRTGPGTPRRRWAGARTWSWTGWAARWARRRSP